MWNLWTSWAIHPRFYFVCIDRCVVLAVSICALRLPVLASFPSQRLMSMFQADQPKHLRFPRKNRHTFSWMSMVGAGISGVFKRFFWCPSFQCISISSVPILRFSTAGYYDALCSFRGATKRGGPQRTHPGGAWCQSHRRVQSRNETAKQSIQGSEEVQKGSLWSSTTGARCSGNSFWKGFCH